MPAAAQKPKSKWQLRRERFGQDKLIWTDRKTWDAVAAAAKERNLPIQTVAKEALRAAYPPAGEE